MAEITASLVKELRERTGAGMMECKKALTENSGDIDVSAEWLRKQGLAKADKKAGRVAAEGRIAMAQSGNKAVLVEINSETDFVAKDNNFLAFTESVAQAALASGAADAEALKSAKLASGETVEETRAAVIAKVGENVQVRRLVSIDSVSNNIAAYVHGGRIGVLVELKGGDAELAVNGLRVFLPAESRLLLDGVTVDFADTPLQSGLTFFNPNAESCACATAGDAKPPAQASVALSSIKRR